MYTKNTIRGIAIVADIANTANKVNQTFTKEQLCQLLALFDQHPSNDKSDYVMPDKLVLWSYTSYYTAGNTSTAENIKKAFPWFDKPSEVDFSLLE